MQRARKLETFRKFRSHATQADFNLLASVRTALGTLVTHPAALDVTTKDGQIHVRGPVLPSERDRVISAIQAIPGVVEVRHELESVSDPKHFVDQRSDEYQLQYSPDFFQGSLAKPLRIAIGVTGLGLIGLGFRNRGATRLALSILGAGALLRATKNISLSRLVGFLTVPSVRLKRTVTVNAPVDRVYAFWKDFKNYPKFMSYVRDVRVNDRNGLRWTAIGPRNVTVQWDATVTALQDNQLISWRSLPNSLIANEGKISFSSGFDSTEVHIELLYAPPAGTLGYALVRLLGFDPSQKIDQDLEVMRKLIEGATDDFSFASARLDY